MARQTGGQAIQEIVPPRKNLYFTKTNVLSKMAFVFSYCILQHQHKDLHYYFWTILGC